MQKRPGQGTFGGRFGGRKSLQSRKSGRFGGTFGGRNSQTETKLMHVRRHFRRPKLPDRDESLLSGAGFGSRKACLPSHVRRPKVLRLPNLVSAKGQKLGSFCTFRLKTFQTCIKPILQHPYTSIHVPRGLKPS
ncbi:hypothetical protein MANES_10G054551v8 [Manihot esculenta]|uniref:Uncharacterized protein n=1 Tax=Manihot esculenta TaxID=3983 RepID=A0ACB7GYD8_MANES|nr:hypothetical protein MANES_10G054551v8 [Manihot esculenta]